MKLIDRIALNRAISIVLNFILAVLKIFSKEKPENTPKPTTPKKKPLKDLIDNVLPWRKK